MSSRSIGYGICPKCGNRGVLIIKELSGGYYAYYRHGKVWHYIGPLSMFHDQLINSLDNEYRESLRKLAMRISATRGTTVNKQIINALVDGLTHVRRGILWLMILSALFYVIALTIVISRITPIARAVGVVNAVISLVLTYVFLLGGFNVLSSIDYARYGMGLSGTYLRFVGISLVMAVDAMYGLSIMTSTMVVPLTVIAGVIIIVSWALIYTAILRSVKYIDLDRAIRIGMVLALMGYSLDLVPGLNAIGPLLQIIGEALIVMDLGIAIARLKRES
ncbi:hypothetical protein VMUT_1184 [Vulcanisaeta moutnovskia 768-28]|uniref:Uncharacterized protein n=1 Tax=Vulcanisaeta moutnovskia (strain 768-28) TaxID=985053 RepID=F0QYF6_VULM7|nr:hypothetical protein [Vulcanisaeta moutnovskia]ADY01389.1 hypothetical protein VMUT_1184 [Vulcanisaeta moutnovskia 768-28]